MSKPEAATGAKVDSPHLAALKQKAANLKAKIADRIPKFSESRRAESLARAQSHLEKVEQAIKRATKQESK